MKKYRVLALALLAGALFSSDAYAQQRRITGRVTVAGTGEVLASAAVNIVGTAIGTYTSDDGTFQLLVPSGDLTLLARRVGFKRATVRVGAEQAEVNVSLERDVLQLETQVVTGTATTVSTQNVANAVTVISTNELNRAPASTIDNALQGKIAGAVITQNSGAPGGGVQVQLRGVTSLNASSSPLYVVDGVVVNNAAIANGLNAITGAAGGNAPSSQDQMVNRVADLNPNDIETIEVLKGASAGAIYGSRGSNGVIVITTKRGRSGKPAVSVTQRFGTFELANKLGLRCFSQAEAVALFGITPAEFTGCHDFEQELYGRRDLSYESIASISGGSATTQYFVSGLVKRDAGIEQNTGYGKQSVRINVGQQLGTRLNLQANAEILHTLTERGISGNDNGGYAPYTVFSQTPTFYDLRPRGGSYPHNPYTQALGGADNNPLQQAALTRTPEDLFRQIGSVTARLSLFTSDRQTLDLTSTGGVDHYGLGSKLYSPPELYYEPADGYPGTIVDNNTSATNANLNATLAHKFSMGSLLGATTSLGFRRNREQLQSIYNTGRNIPSGQTAVSYGVIQASGETQRQVKDLSYFAQEELLMLNETLLLTAAVNSERSSVNGDPQKFYSYPKASASYRLPILPPFTDGVKLRIAYGKAGNKPPFESPYSNLVVTFIDNRIGERPSRNLGNPNIKPETSTELEGGVDAQFWGGRAAIEYTRFRKQVDDLIIFPRLAGSTGYGLGTENGGQLVNLGTEIGLKLQPIHTDLVDWISNTTYSDVHGEITRLDVPSYLYGIGFGAGYGDVRIRKGHSPTEVVANFNGGEFAVGDAQPDYTMGFSNDVNVGPFRFASLLDWRKGGKVVNLTNAYYDAFFADGSGLLADTAASISRSNDFQGPRAVYVEEGGFLKIREIAVSVGIPERFMGVVGSRAKDVRLELSGRNLKTWTKYTGLDPEVSNFSNQNVGRIIDVTPFPPSRSYFVSVSAHF
ncbi:MAG TPA: TonB-dependent receptor plug domain-containing protein [Gemmatimonadaceae bacterium]|nr:TonB-dependent receptor plug domain-containing protein [Gemmatimonadaceae bacterium]